MDYSFSFREFLSDLRKLRSKHLPLDGIVIKSHGSKDGLTDEDGATLVVFTDAGSERVEIVWPDGTMTDITALLRHVTGPNTTISLRGCNTADVADRLAQVLGRGIVVSGMTTAAIGLPFTDASVGVWHTYSYPDEEETPAQNNQAVGE